MSRTYRSPHVRDPPSGTPTPAETNSRQVNDLLHNLRGEQFRHAQNVRRAQARMHPRTLQTLPVSLIYDAEAHTAAAAVAPVPDEAVNAKHTFAWRSHALALVYARLPARESALVSLHAVDREGRGEVSSVPALAQLCLRMLLAYYPDPAEFAAELVPWLAPHMRRDIVRYTAVRAPLGNVKLNALCGPDGHADGELIIVGPSASVRLDTFRRRDAQQDKQQAERDEEGDWDARGRRL